ncbi:MaoC family dehydratase [Janibacter sp. YB324]|nr:MaoC family dehydratase [Janibacter sp. YB324]
MDVTDLSRQIGGRIGPGPWHRIDQDRIDRFALATGDDQWIHVDPQRAGSSPFGGTIAHGYLTLSLLPKLQNELRQVTGISAAVNYGLDSLRFPTPVPAGSRVRLTLTITGVQPRPDGSTLLRSRAEIEVEGHDRPACVADTLTLLRPA